MATSFYTGPSFSTASPPSYSSSFSHPSASSSSRPSANPFSDFLLSFSLPLSPKTQSHLTYTYTLLSVTLLASALGALVHVYYNVGGFLTNLACFALLFLIASDRGMVSEPLLLGYSRRVWALLAFGFFQGCSIGPLVDVALDIDPAIISTAFIVTANLFVCLSLTAIYVNRRAFFALASILSVCTSTLLWITLISFFFPSVFLYTIHIYLGLFVFLLYILFDTQMIIEKVESGAYAATAGADSAVDSALTLFMDFMAVFVRILVILIRNSQAKEKRRDRRS